MNPGQSSPPPTLPGAGLLALARFLFDPDTVRGVIEPGVADLQMEWTDAMRAGRLGHARWIWLAGVFHCVRTMLLLWASRGVFRLRDAAPIFAPAVLATLVGVLVMRAPGAGDAATSFARNQLVYVGIGLLLAALASPLPRPRDARGAYVAMGLSVLLSLAVLVRGETIDGIRGWLSLGPLRLQVSQWHALLFVIAAHGLLARGPRPRGLAGMGMALGIMGIPVALAPDLVVALVLGAVAVAAAASAGARRREVAAFGMAGVLLAALAFARHAAVVGARPWGPPAWVEALRSAGLMGHGLRATFPEPQAHTEAILALIAHRAGLLGFIGVLSLLLATLVGLRSRSRLAAEPHGRVVATSVAVALFAQASAQLLLGDGMVLLGYGGSSMVVTLLLLGLASRARTAQLGDGAVAAGQ